MLKQRDNKVLSLIFVLFSLFILVFFTKSIFYEIQEKQGLQEQLQIKLDKAKRKLKNLNTLEKTLKISDKQKEISRFKVKFSEDKLLKYIFEYVEMINKQKGEVAINISSINFSKPADGDLGFKEVTIDINARVIDVETMKNFLLFLTNKNAKYTFYITNFSFPNDGRVNDFSISIPLKLIYK